MAKEQVPVSVLTETLPRRVGLIRGGLDADEKWFLLSMKQGKPNWDVLGIPHLRDLPALQWKLQNIRRMNADKRVMMLEKLRRVLES